MTDTTYNQNILDSVRESNTAYVFKPKKIRDLVEGYSENKTTGQVIAFGGKLNLRPAYQREYIYKGKKRQAVIETIINGAPLSNMYWLKKENGEYECVDGQQRAITICHFIKGIAGNDSGDWSIKFRGNDCFFHSLPKNIQERILDYELQVYEITGTHEDVIHWFRTINIPGMELTEQELRNSVYTGTWLNSAKEYFSRVGAGADSMYKHLTGGETNRQGILEIALYWITGDYNKIEQYMSKHQHDENADELINHFQNVCEWAEKIIGDDSMSSRIQLGKNKFSNKIEERQDWGSLYRLYHDKFVIDQDEIKMKMDEIIRGDIYECQNSGVYPYIISGDVRHLNRRSFPLHMRERKYKEQKGICPICKKHFKLNQMDGDHIRAHADGGGTTYENLQMLCKDCNNRKGRGFNH